MSIEQKIKQVPGVLWVDLAEEGNDLLVDVIAHADAVNNLTQEVYVDTIMKVLEKADTGKTYRVAVTKIRVEAGVDSIKRQLEEMEGVIGVHLSPVEWTEDKQVKKVQFVVSVDESRFESVIFEETFKRLVKSTNVRVALKVDFVLYRPKTSSLVL